jgi:hypothetical protein
MTYRAYIEITISMPRKKVFELLCDFGNVQKFVPDFLESCSCEGKGVGAVRTVRLTQGGTATERFDLMYEDRIFGYTLISHDVPHLLPIADYFAAVLLEDSPSGGTVVRWGSNWTLTQPEREAEVRDLLEGLYAALIENMAATGD